MEPQAIVTGLSLYNPGAVVLGFRESNDFSAAQCADDRLFRIFLASSTWLKQYGTGRITFLYGPSSSGKTAICRQIKAICPQTVVEGIDNAMEMHYRRIISEAELFKKYFPSRYDAIAKCVDDEEIPGFLKGKKINFKPWSSMEEISMASEAASHVSIVDDLFFDEHHRNIAQKALFERVFSLSLKGQDVIVDTVDCEDFLRYKVAKSFHCPLLVTMVHCSFEKLSDHIEQRNRDAIISGQEIDARYGTYPFLEYTDCFKPVTDAQRPHLHIVSRGMVIDIYDRHLKSELETKHGAFDFNQSEAECVRSPEDFSQVRNEEGFQAISKSDQLDSQSQNQFPTQFSNKLDSSVSARRNFELGVLLSRLGLEDRSSSPLTIRGYADLDIDTGSQTPRQGALTVLHIKPDTE